MILVSKFAGRTGTFGAGIDWEECCDITTEKLREKARLNILTLRVAVVGVFFYNIVPLGDLASFPNAVVEHFILVGCGEMRIG